MKPNNVTKTLTTNVRATQPSMRLIGKWREEWVATGADHRMTFQSYKKGKCIQFHKQRRLKRLNKY